ncbi:MAG: retroviral-like aspartic protease family protein [Chloroflexi bacterium]|nr:retroviral-like aspartic protease family protein [Chloroflexota bacterium]
MIAYDNISDPPAPFLPVMLSNISQTQPKKSIPALLDTGSDVTAIPDTMVERLQLTPIGRLQLENVDAETTIVFTYAIQLTIAEVTIPQLEVILTGFDFVVLGRDVLNRFYVLLNGPEFTLEIDTSPLI